MSAPAPPPSASLISCIQLPCGPAKNRAGKQVQLDPKACAAMEEAESSVHPDYPDLRAFLIVTQEHELGDSRDPAHVNGLWCDCFGAEESIHGDVYLLHSPEDGVYESLTAEETSLVKEMIAAGKRVPKVKRGSRRATRQRRY